jgi:hypothetical protein
MKTVQQQMEDFGKLAFEEKKEIVFAVVQGIKDVNDDTRYLYATLPTIKNIDEDLLTTIYQNVAEVAEQIRKWMKVDAIKNIDIIRQKIQKIQELEAIDRAKENPEDLLKDL